MSIFTIAGDDTFTILNRVLRDFAHGDVSMISIPNDLATGKTGKNRNTIFAKNEPGSNGECSLKMMRGSSDDIFLNAALNGQIKDFAASTLITGQFVKRLGDGVGNITNDVYTLSGGIWRRLPDVKENTDGDIEQGVATYMLWFGRVERSLQ